MPAKNSRKQYIEQSYYHLYNRGVEKRLIFMDRQDYPVFLSYLKEYLTFKDKNELYDKLNDPDISYKERDKIIKLLRLNNFYNEITLVAYCLMPNHFHLLIKQNRPETIDVFMNSLCTRYSMYFNRKYKRVGSLYQDVYKAVLVTSEEQLLHLSCYIHRQAICINKKQERIIHPCSYPEYLGKRKTSWIHPELILGRFKEDTSQLSYQVFVKQAQESNFIHKLTIEAD